MENNDAAKKIADTAAKAEAKVDEIAGKVTDKLDDVLPDSAKGTAKDLADKAEAASHKVEKMAASVEGIADSLLPDQAGTNVELQPQWEENISRAFLFRLLRLIPQYFILIVWGIIALVFTIIFYLQALLTGKRNKRLRNSIVRYYRHNLKRGMYIFGMIDARPEIIVK